LKEDAAAEPGNRRKVVPATQPRYSKEEFAQRGDATYEGKIRPLVEAENQGKFVAIDIETGAYERRGLRLDHYFRLLRCLAFASTM